MVLPTASLFQTHYFIIGTTYQRDDVRDRQRDLFQNLHFRRAGRRASHTGSHVALDVTSVVALVCGQSRDCRVCRRVPNRARVGVFCTLSGSYHIIPQHWVNVLC